MGGEKGPCIPPFLKNQRLVEAWEREAGRVERGEEGREGQWKPWLRRTMECAPFLIKTINNSKDGSWMGRCANNI